MPEPQSSGRSHRNDDHLREAALAEFAALRAEIVARITLQHQVIVLYLTTSGAIFSIILADFAVSSILLPLAPLGYLFSAHYASLDKAIVKSASYIRIRLNKNLDGHLGYEDWLRNSGTGRGKNVSVIKQERRRWINPLYLTFPGVSLFGLAAGMILLIVGYPSFKSVHTWPEIVAEVLIAAIGVLAVIFGFRTVAQVARNHQDEALEQSDE